MPQDLKYGTKLKSRLLEAHVILYSTRQSNHLSISVHSFKNFRVKRCVRTVYYSKMLHHNVEKKIYDKHTLPTPCSGE